MQHGRKELVVVSALQEDLPIRIWRRIKRDEEERDCREVKVDG